MQRIKHNSQNIHLIPLSVDGIGVEIIMGLVDRLYIK